MKSERQLIEECIEEKTKELHQAAAQLENLSSGGPSSSFSLADARAIMAQFQAQQNANKIKQELELLQLRRTQIIGDTKEEELIQGNKESVLKCLSGSPDGIYRLTKVIERETHGEE